VIRVSPRFSRGNKVYRDQLPVTNQKALLAQNDEIVLQHKPLPPLEHGGVNTEMGADLTYEELRADQNIRLSTYDDDGHDERAANAQSVVSWYVGIIALVVSFIALFVWPFWTGVSGLLLSVMAYRQGTRAIAWVSGTLSIIAIIMSVFGYFYNL